MGRDYTDRVKAMSQSEELLGYIETKMQAYRAVLIEQGIPEEEIDYRSSHYYNNELHSMIKNVPYWAGAYNSSIEEYGHWLGEVNLNNALNNIVDSSVVADLGSTTKALEGISRIKKFSKGIAVSLGDGRSEDMKVYDSVNSIFQLTGDLMNAEVREAVRHEIFEVNINGADLIIARPLGGLQSLEFFTIEERYSLLDFVVSLLSKDGVLFTEFPQFCIESYKIYGLLTVDQARALKIITSKLRKRYKPRDIQFIEIPTGFTLRIS